MKTRRPPIAWPHANASAPLATCPPLPWPERGWRARLDQWLHSSAFAVGLESVVARRRRRGGGRGSERGFGRACDASVAAARLDFAESLFDVRTGAGFSALEQIAEARTLHDLWHLREPVFSLLARRHDQREAGRRLAELDRHFTAKRRPPGGRRAQAPWTAASSWSAPR